MTAAEVYEFDPEARPPQSPVFPTKNQPHVLTEPMDQPTKQRLRRAAQHARKVHPGATGELLFREIMTWEEFGYRLGSKSLIMRVVDQILALPLPASPAKFTPPVEPVVVHRIEVEGG